MLLRRTLLCRVLLRGALLRAAAVLAAEQLIEIFEMIRHRSVSYA